MHPADRIFLWTGYFYSCLPFIWLIPNKEGLLNHALDTAAPLRLLASHTRGTRHECSLFVSALQVQRYSHLSLTAQHNSFYLPVSSVKCSFLFCCFLIYPCISGRAGQIENEWSTKTDCSFHSDGLWENSAQLNVVLVFLLLLWSPQRSLVALVPSFKEKSSWAVA